MHHSNDILLRLFSKLLLKMSSNSLTDDVGSNMAKVSVLEEKIVIFPQAEGFKMLSLCIKS